MKVDCREPTERTQRMRHFQIPSGCCSKDTAVNHLNIGNATVLCLENKKRFLLTDTQAHAKERITLKIKER